MGFPLPESNKGYEEWFINSGWELQVARSEVPAFVNIFICVFTCAIAHSEPWPFFFAKFSNVFRQLAALLGRGVGPSQGLYLHRTAQHRKTQAYIHTLSGIRTHGPSVELSRPRAQTARPRKHVHNLTVSFSFAAAQLEVWPLRATYSSYTC
jgi:hypothetical protein